MRRKLQPPNDENRRVETGAIRFGDDWPGYFMRGDEALSFAFTLKQSVVTLRASEKAMDVIASFGFESIANAIIEEVDVRKWIDSGSTRTDNNAG